MKYEKVVGRQIPDGWTLFRLKNGTAAYVEKDGTVGFFYSWAQPLRFTMVDARGPSCVPPEQLRAAIETLERVEETNEWYQHVSEQRARYDREDGGQFLNALEAEHEEWCRNAKTHPDGRLVWGYDDENEDV